MRGKKRIIVTVAAAAAVFWGGCELRRQYTLPVLMYHSVTAQRSAGDRLSVSPDTFERQMAFLAHHGYTVLPLSEAAAAMRQGKKLSRTVAITFDDGYEDNYTNAFPVLLKYRLPATVYVIVSQIGLPGRLTWDQIKQMQASGLVSFGSHTSHHIPLPGLSPERVREEVSASKVSLEERLGQPVDSFAYPLGAFDQNARKAAVDAGYDFAVATNPGGKYPDNDLFLIKRLRISENAANLFVFWFETTGYYNFIREIRDKY